jgi:catechol 2,3-dioxygenase
MATQTSTDHEGSIAAGSTIGRVSLTVRDIARAREFYEQAIGLVASEGPDGSVLLAPARWPALIALHGDPAAPPRDPHQTGLFHQAILLPTRRDLAVALVRLSNSGWRLSGASDHLVSEALYLQDPEGNGIEIYSDRDRSEWTSDEHGQVQMNTLPLDIEDLLRELERAPIDPEADRLMPEGTRIGHIHLQVADIASVERFYAGVLGFDVMVRTYPGALFVSAGGYHHHVGLNVWNSRGGSTPPPGGVGLRDYEIKLGTADALAAALARVEEAGITIEDAPGVAIGGAGGDGAALVRDPSANGILLTV